MGDRYELVLKCAYCGETNYDVWFAPTCGSYTFTCAKCKRKNFIAMNTGFTAKKVEDATTSDVREAFEGCSIWNSPENIDEICKETLKQIQEENKC